MDNFLSNGPKQKDHALLYLSLYVVAVILLILAGIFFVLIPRIKNNRRQMVQNVINPSNVASSTRETTPPVYKKILDAKTSWAEGNYEATLTDAKAALALANSNEEKAYSHYWMGVAYYKLNNPADAQTEEKTSLQLLPQNSAPYVTLAAIELDSNNPSKALEYAQMAVSIDPEYGWAQNVYGMSLILNGRKEEGITALKKANQLDPNNYVFKLNLTRAQNN